MNSSSKLKKYFLLGSFGTAVYQNFERSTSSSIWKSEYRFSQIHCLSPFITRSM